MNVLLLNGSPRQYGCTRRALDEVSKTLESLGDTTCVSWVGKQVNGCTNCRACKVRPNPQYCVQEDCVNEFIKMVPEYDALIIGSPVYYSNITGQLMNFLTRCFYSAAPLFKGKYAAAVTSSRRAGNLTAMNAINAFFLMHGMTVVGSQYWNEVHGDTPDELEFDKEGLQTMRRLAYNMHNAVCHTDLEFPEKHIHTNFISREFLAMQR